MKKVGDNYFLERDDLIRINRLVRSKIDMPAFHEWYDSISKEEQVALALELHTCAIQTGFQSKVWNTAIKNSLVSSELCDVLTLIAGDGTIGKLITWLIAASDDDRRAAFRLLVHVFGESEAAVMEIETPDSCNHWWHRDLHNPAVISDLMSNPNWNSTSPEDDCGRGQ